MFEGKKTYAVMIALVVYAVLGALLGYVEPQHAFELVVAALGGSAMRAAI